MSSCKGKTLEELDAIIHFLKHKSGCSSAEHKTSESEKAFGSDKQTFITIRTTHSHGENVSKFPVVGLGTWKASKGEVGRTVEWALDAGYLHIDGAMVYENEKEIGEVFKKKIGKTISRSDLFVTSKLWNTYHHPDDVAKALKKTLADLQLDYLDLYLIHWPITFERGDDLFPMNKDGSMKYGEAYPLESTWKAMEQCVELGLTKHIGLSNFNSKQVLQIIKAGKIRPTVLQCESHPYLTQEKLIKFCKDQGIVFTAYSPLGSPDRPWAKAGEPSLFDDQRLKDIAKSKKTGIANILIRYQVQRGVTVLPKSTHKDRIKSNLEVWHFELSDKEMQLISELDRDWRACLPTVQLSDGSIVSRDGNHPFWPFVGDF